MEQHRYDVLGDERWRLAPWYQAVEAAWRECDHGGARDFADWYQQHVDDGIHMPDVDTSYANWVEQGRPSL